MTSANQVKKKTLSEGGGIFSDLQGVFARPRVGGHTLR